jgi:hypothetical protein
MKPCRKTIGLVTARRSFSRILTDETKALKLGFNRGNALGLLGEVAIFYDRELNNRWARVRVSFS